MEGGKKKSTKSVTKSKSRSKRSREESTSDKVSHKIQSLDLEESKQSEERFQYSLRSANESVESTKPIVKNATSKHSIELSESSNQSSRNRNQSKKKRRKSRSGDRRSRSESIAHRRNDKGKKQKLPANEERHHLSADSKSPTKQRVGSRSRANKADRDHRSRSEERRSHNRPVSAFSAFRNKALETERVKESAPSDKTHQIRSKDRSRTLDNHPTEINPSKRNTSRVPTMTQQHGNRHEPHDHTPPLPPYQPPPPPPPPEQQQTNQQNHPNKNFMKHLQRMREKFIHRVSDQTVFGVRLSHGGVSSPLVTFSVASYNVLSQDLIEDNPYLYESCEPLHLSWPHRREQLEYEIRHMNTDVLCLQEVNFKHYDEFFKPFMTKLGYHCCYLKRTGPQQDGCATFTRLSTFTVDHVVPVPYHRHGDHILDRHNVGLLVILRHVAAPQSRVVVANTHLLYNPRRGDVKLAQLMVLLAEVDRWAWRGRDLYHPVVMTGDFNSLPRSPIYQLLVSGRLEFAGMMARELSGQEIGSYSSGGNWPMGREAVAREHGITDQCQYEGEVEARRRVPEAPQRGVRDTEELTASVQNILDRFKQLQDSSSQQDSRQNSSTVSNSQHISASSIPVSPLMDPAIVASGASHKPSTPEPDQPNTAPHALKSPTFGSGVASHDLHLSSVYTHGSHHAPEVTTFHDRASCSVDLILYSRDPGRAPGCPQALAPSISPGELRLVSARRLLTDPQLRDGGQSLPNQVVGSDHFALGAVFALGV